MKKNFFTLIICLFSTLSFSQTPQAFSYQAIAYDTFGNIVSTAISLEICIHDVSLTGTIIYKERYTDIVPTNQGVFSLNIGQGVVQSPFTSATFKNINWGINTKHLEVKIDPTSGTGTNYIVNGGNQLLSVPYALYAQKNSSSNSIVTVQNIDKLRSYYDFDPTNDSENVTVYVQGWTFPADGGGGTFIFKRYAQMGSIPSATDPDPHHLRPHHNGGVYIDSYDGNYSSQGIWIRQFSGDIDVRYFGAIGDSRDCTTQFQNAIDYAYGSLTNINEKPLYGSNNSNTVFIPNGNYTIQQLTLKSGVSLKGDSKENTVIVSSTQGGFSSLFKIAAGVVRDVHISGMTIYGNSDTNYKSCFYIQATAGTSAGGGLWESTFKNININQFSGHSMYFEGGTGASVGTVNYSLVNQFLVFEGVYVEGCGQCTISNHDYNALSISGLNGQFSFSNCRFDGGSFIFGTSTNSTLAYTPVGRNVYIGTVGNGIVGPELINFNTCTFQGAEIGIYIESTNAINIYGCWFDILNRAIAVKGTYKKSLSINIMNNTIARSSGRFGTLNNASTVISYDNAQLNVLNNYISDYVQGANPNVIPLTFIRTDNGLSSSNLGVTASGNSFYKGPDTQFSKDIAISQGLKKDIDLANVSNNMIDIQSSKAVYLKNTSGTTKVVNEIWSNVSAGEIIVIRADQGDVRFNETKNIYLGQMKDPSIPTNPPSGQLTLNNGGIAMFVKIDEQVVKNGVTYYETYNLVSYKLRQ